MVRVGVGTVTLACFIQYSLPEQVVALGRVTVAAAVPVYTIVLSVAAVVEPVIARYFAAKEPLTSRVEFGVVVPIPICALANTENTSMPIVNNFFIGSDWPTK
jgi:hypothetical protein